MSTAVCLPSHFAVPSCEKGLGAIIQAPDSAELIDGVRVLPFRLFPDDRGYFLEVARMGAGGVAAYPPESTQVSYSRSYPGTIKAFHYHQHQTDFWVPVAGMLQVALVDLRRESPTFGRRNTIYTGDLRTWQLLIPAGVAHGYKVISPEAAALVYVTDRHYNPADEGRIPFNDDRIQYDWDTQHR